MPRRVGLRIQIALLLLMAAMARAETPVFRSFGAAQGLPSERVYALAQDPHGCLWAGTADGLARFDGSQFHVLHHDPARADSLPSNVIQALHLDHEGRLWVGSEGGGVVEVVDEERRLRRPAGLVAEDHGLDVWAIARDGEGVLWFGGYGSGLRAIHPDRGERRVYPASDAGLASAHVLNLLVAPDGALWIGSERGLQRFAAGQWQRFGDAEGLPAKPVLSLALADGRLRVGSAVGVFEQTANGTFAALEGAPQAPALDVFEDATGSRWYAGLHGLLRQPLSPPAPAQAALPPRSAAAEQSVHALLGDDEGGLWVASGGGGLLHLPPRWQRFRSWRVGEDSLASRLPSGLAFDAEGRLWSAGGDGLVERIEPDGSVNMVQPPAADWPDRQLRSLWFTDGAVWLGYRSGFLRLAQGNRAERHWRPTDADDAPALGTIDQAVVDDDGRFWLLVHGGGIEHRERDGRLRRRYGSADGLGGDDNEQFRLGPDGQPWVAGAGGLFRLDPAAERFIPVAEAGDERVFGFAFDEQGGLWLARRRGLRVVQRDGEGWRPGRDLPALSGLEVGGLAADRHGGLWAHSARGLWRIDRRSGRARRYGVRDGLPGQEFPPRPMAESADGRLAAALPTAVLLIDPALFVDPGRTPPLLAEAVSLRRDGLALRLPFAGPLVLDHGDREIAFSARVRSFAEPDGWHYRLRLSPLDTDWVELGAAGRRVYPSLPPGQYRLEFAAEGPEGQASQLPPLALTVAPPWWQQTPARLGQLGLLALILFALYRALRWRAERRAASALSDSQRRWALAASAQKSQFLATLAHEIRTPMTGLLGMAELLAEAPLAAAERERVAALRRSGVLLLRLVNDALDLARIEAGRLEIRPRPVRLRPLLEDCLALCAATAAAKRLRLDLDVASGLPEAIIVDGERLQQILLNLLGNALKFTCEGGVRLDVDRDAVDTLVFRVIDSGPGMAPAEQARLLQRFEQGDGEDTARQHGGAGLGLAISSELARLMQGTLQIASTVGSGTEVRLSLPLLAAVPPETTPAATAASRGRHRVLLVEDDPAAADALVAMLEHLDCAVRHAGHALQALTALAEAPADLALVDLDLPMVDGLQLLPMLAEAQPGLVQVVISARSEAEAAAAARAAGAIRYLSKPTSLDALREVLQEVAPARDANQ